MYNVLLGASHFACTDTLVTHMTVQSDICVCASCIEYTHNTLYTLRASSQSNYTSFYIITAAASHVRGAECVSMKMRAARRDEKNSSLGSDAEAYLFIMMMRGLVWLHLMQMNRSVS